MQLLNETYHYSDEIFASISIDESNLDIKENNVPLYILKLAEIYSKKKILIHE